MIPVIIAAEVVVVVTAANSSCCLYMVEPEEFNNALFTKNYKVEFKGLYLFVYSYNF